MARQRLDMYGRQRLDMACQHLDMTCQGTFICKDDDANALVGYQITLYYWTDLKCNSNVLY